MASNKKNEKDVRSSYGNPSTHETMHLMFHMAGKSNADWHCKDSPVAAYLVLVNTKDAKSVLPFRIGFNLFVSGTPHLVVSQVHMLPLANLMNIVQWTRGGEDRAR